MAFTPEFINQFAAFQIERNQLEDLTDWRLFVQKWFPLDSWPEKSPEQIEQESLRKRGPVEIGGRDWCYTSWTYDLTAEARYEYFWTLIKIGDPIRFPNLTVPDGSHWSESGWRQECPFCELSTDELREEVCPVCKRELILRSYAG